MSRVPHINMAELQKHNMEREKCKLPKNTYNTV